MRAFSLAHLSDQELLRSLSRLVVQHRATTAAMLAHIAEVDARRLYAPAGYPSMHWYCVRELRLSEDAAFKRIQAARAARAHPVIFEALEDGRLHLGAVCLLAPRLRQPHAEDLIASAMHRTKEEIAQLLARRFPQSESLPLVQAIPATSHSTMDQATSSATGTPCLDQLAPGQVAGMPAVPPRDPSSSHVSAPLGRVEIAAPAPAELATRSFVRPHALGRYTLQLNLSQETYDRLRYVQALLSHQIPSANIAEAIDRALDALIEQLEKKKFAATRRPHSGTLAAGTQAAGAQTAGTQAALTGSRYIPSRVKRAVWKRDGGQCTFVGSNGQRCPARSFIEFDHIEPVARGGRATVDGIRLRCRTHNQYGAEQAFGPEFMSGKRRAAAAARSAASEGVDETAKGRG